MRRFVLSGSFLAGFIASVGCGQTNTQGTATAPPGGVESMSKFQAGGPGVVRDMGPAPGAGGGAKELFSAHCAKCHGLDGASPSGAMKGPDLTKAGADAAHTADWIAEHIKNPKAHKPESRMPGFEKKLTAEEVKALADDLAKRK